MNNHIERQLGNDECYWAQFEKKQLNLLAKPLLFDRFGDLNEPGR